jgi:DNA-binding FrmR family transcriptional regulator
MLEDGERYCTNILTQFIAATGHMYNPLSRDDVRALIGIGVRRAAELLIRELADSVEALDQVKKERRSYGAKS